MTDQDEDDFARFDGNHLARHARHLGKFWRKNNRLPYPAGNDVREAYEVLGEIVAGLDAKKEKAHAA